MTEPPLELNYGDELVQCSKDPVHFITRFCHVYDGEAKAWIPFVLWPLQENAVRTIHRDRRVVILKARQMGATWFCLAYILWSMLFRPIAKPLVFSRTEEDAFYLLGDERLRGMHKLLPAWMVAPDVMNAVPVGAAARTFELGNGSLAHAFPPNRGDSYTGTVALADEFDILSSKEQEQLLRSVKPTVDAGGKFIMLSRSNKTQPESIFKKTFVAAEAGKNGWTPFFMSWHDHPGRDQAWYADQERQAASFPSPQDYLWEQYPGTAAQALAPNSLDKRIPSSWLMQCFQEEKPLDELPRDAPSLPGLEVYRLPETGQRYVIGADPAEGNPTSDPSAATVLERDTGEECACLAGRLDVAMFSEYLDQLGQWYNNAALMVERNNHGAAVIMWLQEHSELELLKGHDDKVGWLSSQKGKKILYSACADAFRCQEVVLHSFATFTQLGSIEGSTLRAPDKQNDDRSDSFALAAAAPPPSCYESRGLTVLARA